MPIVNYIREHRRFIQYASDEKLTANERLLWYALMEIMNQRADGCVWPGEFIRVSNDRVLTLCPMGFDTMAKARNGLKQRGLIDFRPGNKNKENPAYRINYFEPEDYPKISDNIPDNMRGNMRGNTGGKGWDNMEDNPGGNMGDHTQTKTKNNIYTKREMDEEDDVVVGLPRGRGDEQDPIPDRQERTGRIREGFRRAFGRVPYPAELNRLVVNGWRMGFTADMVCLAAMEAAKHGARNPVELTLHILGEWQEAEVRQPHQIEQYAVEHLVETGKNYWLIGTGDPVEDLRVRDEARDRRKRENQEAGA